MKMWSTLGRPNNEEKDRKRRIREAQLTQIQRELTLDRKHISNHNVGGHSRPPQRSKTFRIQPLGGGGEELSDSSSNVRLRSKSTNKIDEVDSQFVSRLRFFDDSSSPQLQKRHSTAFLTPEDDMRSMGGHDLFGMRRRYTMAVDSEDNSADYATSSNRNNNNIVTFAASSSSGGRSDQRLLRFSDQLADMSTSGTNRSSHESYGTSEDGFGDYRSAAAIICYSIISFSYIYTVFMYSTNYR